MALKSTALVPSDEMTPAHNVGHSKTVFDLRKALEGWGSPIQNWVAGDDSGNILYFPAGLVPLRRGWDGTMPVPGWTGEYEWSGFIPPAELPQLLNPPSGMIVTANNSIVPQSDYPYPYSYDAVPGYRAARIVEILKSKEKWTAEGIRAVQMDVRANQARRLLPALLGALGGQRLEGCEAGAYRALAEWDLIASVDSTAMSVFTVTYRAAGVIALRDKLPPELFGFMNSFSYLWGFFDGVWADRPDSWVFDVKSKGLKGRDDVLRAAFREAVAKLSERYGADVASWRWGRLHTLTFRHPFGERRALASTFNVGPFAQPGAGDTVFMGNMKMTGDPLAFPDVHGPAMRQVVDLASPDSGGLILDLGQSGWPLTPGYSNAVDDWRSGRMWRVSTQEPVYSKDATGTVFMTPAK
ncbi:MAG: penicillin acylase family protein, partial [Myxococcota bacterium]|jgi:penicillin amidase